MELPNVATDVRDDTRRVTFRVVAYRKLAPEEAVQLVRVYLMRAKRKPKRDSVVTIVTTIS